MNPILKQVKNINDDVCISIIMNTHRIHPSDELDIINLKNLKKQAEEMLKERLDKREAADLIERLEQVIETIDFRHNMESLAIFVSKSIALYTRLPIAVSDRVIIESNFATRDLIRAMHTEKSYYTLVLGKDRARLIEATNGKVTEDVGGPFPMINNSLFVRTRSMSSNATKVTKYQFEFFNRVDNALWSIWHERPMPVIVAADEKTYSLFMEVSEHPEIIIGVHNDSYDKPSKHIVEDNWPIIEKYVLENNDKRVSELNIAMNSGMVVSDINEIWRTIREGRGKTLFVKNGYYQPAKIVDHNIELVSEKESTQEGVFEDIIDELVEVNEHFGGDTVFIFDDSLDKYNGLALISRY